MTSFAYIARTNEGTLEKGTIEAKSMDAAREKLRKNGLTAEELHEEGSKKAAVIDFGHGMPWTTTDDDLPREKTKRAEPAKTDANYIPLMDTLRLFAGWLLAWYAVVYLIGSLRLSGALGVEIPFIDGLFTSALVLRFAFGTYLFLLAGSVHAWTGKGTGKGIALGVLWLMLTWAFIVNT